jgi:flagellar assembly protein FliH
MMQYYYPPKIEKYNFRDFGEEFGLASEEKADGSVVAMPQNVIFGIRQVPNAYPNAPVPARQGFAPAERKPEQAAASEVKEERSFANEEPVINREEAEKIIAEARTEAEKIIKEAEEAAESIRERAAAEAETALREAEETAYSDGFEKGKTEGYEAAHDEAKKELDEKNHELLEEIKRSIAELAKLKDDYIMQYDDSMKDLVIAIAEKVIKVSLKSSGEVIRRMILAAVENSSKKEWVKIYISEYDANLMVREDSDILDALRKVSDHIKVVKMENGESGDLIVEFPDQAIDASVSTQLENIRYMISDESIMRQNRL